MEDDLRRMNRRYFFFGSMALSALGAGAVGCGSASDASTGWFAWGERGTGGGGTFRAPRAIAAFNEEVYVADRSGRVQVFDYDGVHQRTWMIPRYDKGTPTDIGFDAQGRVILPDTHYSRVLAYTTEGDPVDQWGEYGTGVNQFIYPTGVAWDSQGLQYYSEYGVDAERIHVFDARNQFVRQWGELGNGPGQLNRAMAILIDADDTVFVVDTGNSRIQRFDTQGRWLGFIGDQGPDRLRYPYDAALGPDGTLFVCDYGGHTIRQYSKTGEHLRDYGQPGRGPGRFNCPRGVTVSADGWLFVADTENNRIHRRMLDA